MASGFALEFWQVVCQMAPYLLFGFFAAGLLSVLIPNRMVGRHLGGRGFGPVVKASLLGVPLPLCSCSVIPVTASLRKHGASRGAATAFLISTPQTGVDSILVTWSLLGPFFAIFKPVAAFVSGMLGGALVSRAETRAEPDTESAEACHDTCCSAGGGSKVRRALSYGFVDMPRDLGRPLLLGVLVAGAITAFVPATWFEGVGTGPVAILVLMLAGIPVYVCSTASVPIAAALILKGVSPGAALAFLMTGPATNAAGIATVWTIMGRRTALVYLGTVAVTALAAGLALDGAVSGLGVRTVAASHTMLPDAVKRASAVALLLVLGFGLFRRVPGEDRRVGGPVGHSCHEKEG